MKPSTVLKKYRWCKDYLAKDKEGKPVDVDSEKAVAFCIIGAICKSTPLEEDRRKCYYKLRNKSRIFSISDYNDVVCKSKAEAIRLLKSVGL